MKIADNLKASDIANNCNGKLLGPDVIITGINEIHRVEQGDITFVDHPKYYKSTLQSSASVILINQELVVPEGKTLIVTPKPYDVYASIVAERISEKPLKNIIAEEAKIHPSATIEAGAVIGNKVSIGANTIVHANAVIYGPCTIGSNVRIGPNSVIGELAFYFRGIGENGRNRWQTAGQVHIEDYVEIGANCNIARGVSSITRIGRGTKIDTLCQIGHGTTIGENCLFAAQVGIAGKVNIGNKVTLYGQVGVVQNVTIPDGVIVYGQSGVSKSLEPNQEYLGSPCQIASDEFKDMLMVRKLRK